MFKASLVHLLARKWLIIMNSFGDSKPGKEFECLKHLSTCRQDVTQPSPQPVSTHGGILNDQWIRGWSYCCLQCIEETVNAALKEEVLARSGKTSSAPLQWIGRSWIGGVLSLPRKEFLAKLRKP